MTPITWKIEAIDEVNFSYYDVVYSDVPDFSETSNTLPVTKYRLYVNGGWTDKTRDGAVKAISQLQSLNYFGKPFSSAEEMPLQPGDSGTCMEASNYSEKKIVNMVDYRQARQLLLSFNQPCELAEAVTSSLIKGDNTLINEFNEIITQVNDEFPTTWPAMEYSAFVEMYLQVT
jgi:hypothetical protein